MRDANLRGLFFKKTNVIKITGGGVPGFGALRGLIKSKIAEGASSILEKF